jgi:hypothetical protein
MLPNWLLAKKTMPGGLRLPKRPKFIEQYKSDYIKSKCAESKLDDKVPKDFSNWEFRFWAAYNGGDEDGQAFCECRGCNMYTWDTVVRRSHLGQMGCGRLLTNSFKLLLRDKKCVICDAETNKTEWGVPICSESCRRKWMYEEAQPLALSEAIRLVKENTGVNV